MHTSSMCEKVNELSKPASASLIRQINHYGLWLGIRPHGMDATLSSDPALLGAPERHGLKHDRDAVHADHARVEFACYPESSVDILCEYARHQAVVRVVRELHRLFLGLEGFHNADRPEDFLSVDFRVRVHVCEDSGCDEVALHGTEMSEENIYACGCEGQSASKTHLIFTLSPNRSPPRASLP